MIALSLVSCPSVNVMLRSINKQSVVVDALCLIFSQQVDRQSVDVDALCREMYVDMQRFGVDAFLWIDFP